MVENPQGTLGRSEHSKTFASNFLLKGGQNSCKAKEPQKGATFKGEASVSPLSLEWLIDQDNYSQYPIPFIYCLFQQEICDNGYLMVSKKISIAGCCSYEKQEINCPSYL